MEHRNEGGGFVRSQKDGGPAFPIPDTYHPNGQIEYGANGMSLRDWFAGMALQGILAWPGDDQRGNAHSNASPDVVAWTSYNFADAMIAARIGWEASKAEGRSE